MSPLLRLLAAKDQLLVAVQAIEQQLAPFHAQNPEERNWPTEEARTRCAQEAEACKKLLDEVMQMEEQNEKEMTVRRDQVASQLQAAQAASTARGAYQAQQLQTFQGPHIPTSDYSPPDGTTRLDLHSEV